MENQDRTATEIRFSQQSGDIRLQFQSDKIKRNFNMNLIETIADVKALYESDSIQVLTTDPQTGKDKMVEIDSVVRNGRYRYSYLDDKSIVELQQKFNIMSQWCEQFIPMGFVNVQELFTEGLEQLGVKNPEKLIQQDPVTQVVSQATQNAPDDQKPQIQNQLKQTAAGLLQQHLQQQQTGQQQQPMG